MPPNTIGQPLSATAENESAAPEFGDFNGLRNRFGIPRSTAYELEKEGKIAFVRLRRRGNLRGRVLVNFESVRRYLAGCSTDRNAPTTPAVAP